MNSLTSFFRKINRWSLKRYGQLDDIAKVVDKTGGQYLDEKSFASMNDNMDEAEAREILEEGVDQGLYERRYLYTLNEPAVVLFIGEEDLGKTRPLSDFGVIGPNMNKQIHFFASRGKRVYVPTVTH